MSLKKLNSVNFQTLFSLRWMQNCNGCKWLGYRIKCSITLCVYLFCRSIWMGEKNRKNQVRSTSEDCADRFVMIPIQYNTHALMTNEYHPKYKSLSQLEMKIVEWEIKNYSTLLVGLTTPLFSIISLDSCCCCCYFSSSYLFIDGWMRMFVLFVGHWNGLGFCLIADMFACS